VRRRDDRRAAADVLFALKKFRDWTIRASEVRMIHKTMLTLLMAASLTAGSAGPQSALELYQQALVQEQAAGNLPEAIELYRQAAKGAGNDRNLAARALIRAAGSYEKLGQPAASELYTEVMRTYPEQREQVAFAQSRIAALKRPSPRLTQSNSARSGRTDVSGVFDPMFEMYCTTCHNQNRKTAGLTLDSLNTTNVSQDSAVWERILRRLRARRDPPFGMRRPDEGVYQSAILALELALDQAYPVNASLNTADRVSDSELAVRIAKFIWNGTPDAILLDVVQRGRLREPAVLEQQVRRMLRDPKANNLVTEFFERWVLWDAFEKEQNPALPPSERFTEFDETLRQALGTETRLFLQSQIHEDHNALDLWTANYTYLNDRLARHYGISGVSGSGFQRVNLTDNSRAGLLGHGSFLTVSSQSNRTSPVQRGKMVLAIFFGILPPDPPPNVPALKTDNTRSLRVRMEEHRTNPGCANCHLTFEPLGMALENFNPIGQWRSTDGGPIDASGIFVDGTRFNGPAELRSALVKYRDAYYSNITQTLLGYALGRKARTWRVYDYEMPSVRAIVHEAAGNDYRWSSIILGIVRSTPFQMKTIVP
jgi:Protein of unknown function (DUF1592)/Protein of unknown function (DUF1588)/Protein of unknown function (DUF1585)